jgi:hypothetical protein
LTEKEWSEYPGPYLMLEFIKGRISDRKLLLFGCACCRRILHLMADERSRNAVEVCERYADGLATRQERDGAYGPARIAVDDTLALPNADRPWINHNVAAYHAGLAAVWLLSENIASWESSTEAAKAVRGAAGRHSNADAVGPERFCQAVLLRDIVGNPFKPRAAGTAWRTTSMLALARSIYEERAFDRLPILADALDEAGCDDADMLIHCRQPGPHVRGCWVVDLLLEMK